MRYLCLVYVDRKLIATLTPETDKELTRESKAYDRELERQGVYITADALTEPETAVTIKVRNGKASTTDGPFAETKEHLGGFILIEAEDMQQAVEIGSKIPMARMGSIEVRQIAKY